MTWELRILTLGLASFAAAGLVTSVVVPLFVGRSARLRPAARAQRLTRLRLAPAAAGLGAGLLVAAAFIAFEPRRQDEYMGWVIPAVAVLGGLTLLASVWRGIRLARATRGAVDAWIANAQPIELPGTSIPVLRVASRFPIVAVVGFFRPRLVIAESVLASCTPDELRAILAHERGHLERRDNLNRWLMSLAPDALAWTPASSRLFAAWRAAAEEAADDDAENAGAEGRLSLASALVKVARLASDPPPLRSLPGSALFCGEQLDSRIRRLLQPIGSGDTTRTSPLRTIALLFPAVVVSVLALEALHAVIETAIHALP